MRVNETGLLTRIHALWSGGRVLAVLMMGLIAWACPAAASEGRHALIVGIGNYAEASRTEPLKGIGHDVANARRMALAMGVAPDAIIELRDDRATKSQILAELRRLRERVKPGDRLLVYWSGHGARYAGKDGCVEGLQTWTPGPFGEDDVMSEAELAEQLQPISRVADKVFAFIDACFSGGVIRGTTRSLSGELPQAKFNGTSSAERCSVGVNQPRTRSLLAELSRLGVHQENFVQIASASHEEVSWDSASLGGHATHAMTQCLLGEAKDLNDSGAVSLDELRVCAQTRMDTLIAPHRASGYLPSTLQVKGNRNLVVVAAPPIAAAPATVVTSPASGTSMPAVAVPPASPAVTVAAVPSTPATPPATTPATTPAEQRPPGVPPPRPPQVQVERPVTGVAIEAVPVLPSRPPVAVAPPVVTPSRPPVAVAPPAVAPSRPPVAVAPPAAPPTQMPPPPAPVQLALAPPAAIPALPAAPAAIEALGSIATLQDIYNQRDPRLALAVDVPSRVRIGVDPLTFTVRPGSSGYLYAVLLGSDEKSFYLLFPNRLDADNRVQAGQSYVMPRPGWQVMAAGPPGINRILFVVSASPRDPSIFRSIADTAAGPFSYSVADLGSRRSLVDFFLGKGITGRTAAMGAALVQVEEFR
jgi:hypothetical protein